MFWFFFIFIKKKNKTNIFRRKCHENITFDQSNFEISPGILAIFSAGKINYILSHSIWQNHCLVKVIVLYNHFTNYNILQTPITLLHFSSTYE